MENVNVTEMLNPDLVVEIPEDIVNAIRRFFYDYNSYKDVIANILDIHKLDVDSSFIESPIFHKFMEQYQIAFTAYNASLKQLDKFIPKEFVENGYTWNLNFDTNGLELKRG
jgi:hypothetical protein